MINQALACLYIYLGLSRSNGISPAAQQASHIRDELTKKAIASLNGSRGQNLNKILSTPFVVLSCSYCSYCFEYIKHCITAAIARWLSRSKKNLKEQTCTSTYNCRELKQQSCDNSHRIAWRDTYIQQQKGNRTKVNREQNIVQVTSSRSGALNKDEGESVRHRRVLMCWWQSP